jgi:hypothetical protein
VSDLGADVARLSAAAPHRVIDEAMQNVGSLLLAPAWDKHRRLGRARFRNPAQRSKEGHVLTHNIW